MQAYTFAQAAAWVTVFIIANYRTTEGRELYSYLVRPAGYRIDLY